MDMNVVLDIVLVIAIVLVARWLIKHWYAPEDPVLANIPFFESVVDFMEENTSLYRHYAISDVQDCVLQFKGVNMTSEQTVALVQSLRDKHGLGPIAEYNLPGYTEE